MYYYKKKQLYQFAYYYAQILLEALIVSTNILHMPFSGVEVMPQKCTHTSVPSILWFLVFQCSLIVSTNIIHMPFSGRKNAHTHQFRQYCSFWCFKSQYCVFIQLSEVFHEETSRKQIEHREVGSKVVCMCAALSL